MPSLVGSEMCIRDSSRTKNRTFLRRSRPLPRRSRPPVRSTPYTAVTLFYSDHLRSYVRHGSGPSLLRSTQHTAVTLFVRGIQQSFLFYAAYSTLFLRSIQQSLLFYAAVAPSSPTAAPLFRTPSLLPERRYRISACLRTAEILAFRPLRGTPSSRHVPLYDRNAFHRDCKVGVVISSDFCWGASNSFGGASKRGRFGVLYSSAVPLKKKNVREKNTMGPSFMPLFVRNSFTLRDRGVFF